MCVLQREGGTLIERRWSVSGGGSVGKMECGVRIVN
jgi:hypothetical protein